MCRRFTTAKSVHSNLLDGPLRAQGGALKTKRPPSRLDGQSAIAASAFAGYADTSSHGRVHFVISLAGDDSEMRYRLLGAIKSEL
jgi:D-alanyl-D-alanine carboxypeptidase